MATPNPSSVTGNFRRKYTVTFTQIAAALGATTSGNVYLDTVPAATVIGMAYVKHSASLVGPSLSAATARLITTNNNYGSAAQDVFTAPAAAAYKFDAVRKMETTNAPTDLNLAIVLTGANASALTAGSVDVYFDATALS